jgi:DNA-directed RNA polymerase subunit K
LTERKLFSGPLFRRAEGDTLTYSRFEKARILGARALQISMGAPSVIGAADLADPLEIASREFNSGTAPLTVLRFADAFD